MARQGGTGRLPVFGSHICFYLPRPLAPRRQAMSPVSCDCGDSWREILSAVSGAPRRIRRFVVIHRACDLWEFDRKRLRPLKLSLRALGRVRCVKRWATIDVLFYFTAAKRLGTNPLRDREGPRSPDLGSIGQRSVRITRDSYKARRRATRESPDLGDDELAGRILSPPAICCRSAALKSPNGPPGGSAPSALDFGALRTRLL